MGHGHTRRLETADVEKEGAEGPRTGGGRASRAKGRGPPGRGMVRGGGKGPRSAEKGKEKGRKKKGGPAQSKQISEMLPTRSESDLLGVRRGIAVVASAGQCLTAGDQ